MSQEEREALLKRVLELPEPEQNIVIGAAQMAVTLNDMKKTA